MIISVWTLVFAFMYIPLITLGLIGNVLSFIIYTRIGKTTISLLLSALAFCDFFLLLFALPITCISMLPFGNFNDPHSTRFQMFTYSLKYIFPLLMMVKTASWYILVAITMERWCAVCRPLQVRVRCTYRNSLKILSAILTFSILFHVIKFQENYLLKDRWGYAYLKRSDLYESNWFFIVYDITLSTIVEYLIPFSMMTIFNFQVMRELGRSQRQRQLLTTSQIKEQKTTLMLLVVTILFAICHFLAIGVKIGECITRSKTGQNPFFEFLIEFSNFTIIAHSSVTFIIFFIFSSKYRQGFYELIEASTKRIRDSEQAVVASAARAANQTLTVTLTELTTLMESQVVDA